MECIYSGPQQPQVDYNTDYNTDAYVHIVLDKAYFHEGSLVTGNIIFQLSSSFSSLEVYLALLGNESVFWK